MARRASPALETIVTETTSPNTARPTPPRTPPPRFRNRRDTHRHRRPSRRYANSMMMMTTKIRNATPISSPPRTSGGVGRPLPLPLLQQCTVVPTRETGVCALERRRAHLAESPLPSGLVCTGPSPPREEMRMRWMRTLTRMQKLRPTPRS